MMWELIRSNRRKSMWLFVGMAILLVLLGFGIGTVWFGEQGGIAGIIIALVIWLTMTLISLNSGGDILLRISGAKEVTKDIHPRLHNVVEEMKIAAALPVMPKVYIIDQAAPNAFAIGLRGGQSAVAVTAGLLERLNRDELQGVVAHEVAHILNRDSQLMTVAGIMLGSIVLLSHVFMRSMWFMPSSSRRYKSDSGGSPQIQIIILVVTIVLAILAPIFARLLFLAVSRKREYLADATAVRLTRYPEGLASALEKISSVQIPMETANQVTASMYIASPLARKGAKLSSLDSTHPPMSERIKILRGMTHGADLKAYERAYAGVKGKSATIIPASGLHRNKSIEIRKPSQEDAPKGSKRTARDVMDLMRAMNEYAFLACVCGLKIKLPEERSHDTISCPKCGRKNAVPVAEMAEIAAVVGAAVGVGQAESAPSKGSTSLSNLEYTRRGTGWESFACTCGRVMQLSPAFSGHTLTCKKCGKITRIK